MMTFQYEWKILAWYVNLKQTIKSISIKRGKKHLWVMESQVCPFQRHKNKLTAFRNPILQNHLKKKYLNEGPFYLKCR